MAEKNCVTFIWKICNLHNFEKCVESPEFYVKHLYGSKWTLQLNIPPILSEEVTVYLLNNYKKGAKFHILCEISILATNPQKSVTGGVESISVDSGIPYQIFNNTTWLEISQTMRSEFLPQGTLTVQCRLWKPLKSSLKTLEYQAFTSMGTQKMSYKWFLNDFKSVEDGDTKKKLFLVSSSHPSFSFKAFFIGKKEYMEIVIQQTNKAFSKLLVTCQVSVLDGKGIIVIQNESSHVMNLGKEWVFPRFFDKNFLTSKREDCLINNQLVLLFEITYMADDGYSAIQSMSTFPTQSSTSDELPTSKNPTADAFTSMGEDVSLKVYASTSRESEALKYDLHGLYTLNSFSDITIHGQGRSFPCHKCILSARSPVFLSLFTQSTSEYTVDLDTSTLGILLQFIYTGDCENQLDYQTALKLYKAAGEYQILSLKQICSGYLEEHMTEQNVCDLLLLASELQDMELKPKIEDFILDNRSSILDSSRWREMVETSADLVVDSTYRILMVEMDQFDCSVIPPFESSISYDALKSEIEYQAHLLSIFHTSLFSDFRLVVNGKYFEVHKNILWARSPVFKAMFSSETGETPRDTFKIQDVDDQTIERMLHFVYSANLIDAEYPQLCQLYYAAVKYRISSLKYWCSKSLVKALSVDNVPEILTLSDRHGDDELKNAVLDFVSENDESIILSPEWKKFMKNDHKLASETLYEIYSRKLHGNKSSSESESNIEEISSKDLIELKSDPSSNLEQDLRYLYKEKFQSDFKLHTNKRSFKVHRNILSARSPVFKAMFLSNLKETTTNSLHVQDIDEETLDHMLTYMYCESMEYTESVDLCKLYYAADKYDVCGLRNWCSYTLSEKINVDNVYEILAMADKHGDKDLSFAVLNFLIEKGKEVFNSDSWKDFMLIEPKVACQTLLTMYDNF